MLNGGRLSAEPRLALGQWWILAGSPQSQCQGPLTDMSCPSPSHKPPRLVPGSPRLLVPEEEGSGVHRQTCVQARMGHREKPPEPGAEALSSKLAEGPAGAHTPAVPHHLPQLVGYARSNLVSVPSPLTPNPSMVPFSSTVFAPTRCLSTDLPPGNPCPPLPVSAHPALSACSPHTNHLLWGHWAHDTL